MDSLLNHVYNLENIHGSLAAGRGRRHNQDALHRAGVVMSVAAWESYVEDVLKEAIVKIKPVAGAPLHAVLVHRIAERDANKRVKEFNTPNAQNVRKLFQENLDFDPWPHWTWVAGTRRNWNSVRMQKALNDWLTIRHCVAHGASLPNDIAMLRNSQGSHSIRLAHLQECRDFIKHIATQTDSALSSHLVAQFGIAAPW
jgi:hypothetical protein